MGEGTVEGKYRLGDGRSAFCSRLTVVCAANRFVIPVYAPQVKQLLGFSQTEINTIAGFSYVGTYTGYTMGWFYDTFGVRKTAVAAASFLFCGYFMAWLIVSKRLEVGDPVGFLSFLFILIGQGCHGK